VALQYTDILREDSVHSRDGATVREPPQRTIRDLVLQAVTFQFARNWMTRRFVGNQFNLPAYPD
jgi:hypothetical protein